MWKLAVLLIIGIGSAAAQAPLEINCQFLQDVFGEYLCRFVGIDVADPAQPVNISGVHLTGRTSNDVTVVQIRNSNTPFVIQQIFTSFPNLIKLDIQNSNLQELALSPTVQLKYLTLYRNNLTRIENGTFSGQSQMEIIDAMDNRITDIEVNAFEGLENLFSLMLIGNRISRILPGTFHPMTNLVYLDLEQNRIERIEDDTFSGNPALEALYLEYNVINAISTTFTSGLSKNLEYLNIQGNRCIDRQFALREPIDMILLNNALITCFNNFIGEIPTVRRITLEFTGPLSLFDEFGNIIARVN